MSGLRGVHVAVCLAGAMIPWPCRAQTGGGPTLAVGAFGLASRRSAAFDGSVGTANAFMTGVSLGASLRYVGVSARLFGGSYPGDSAAGGKLANGDLTISGGWPVFAGMLGYGRRGFTGAFGSISWSFWRAGVQSDLALGSSGLHAQLSLATYVGVSRGASGKEGETRLTWEPSGAPVFITLGYRIEQFTTVSGAGPVPDDVSGVLLGAGWRWSR